MGSAGRIIDSGPHIGVGIEIQIEGAGQIHIKRHGRIGLRLGVSQGTAVPRHVDFRDLLGRRRRAIDQLSRVDDRVRRSVSTHRPDESEVVLTAPSASGNRRYGRVQDITGG